MAAGPLLAPAIEELSALPPTAHERAVAEQILINLQHSLGQQPRRTPEEQEFIVTMYKSWEEGRAEARIEERANAVLTVLRVRGIAVPEAARKRILAQKDLQRLERWLKKASIATSIGEVIDDRVEERPSRPGRPAAHKERSRRRSARVPAHR
jgi:hypothetical protein